MMERPVLTGTIPSDGVLGLLRQIEELRTTGVLRFESPRGEGTMALVRGEIASDQPALPGGEDPVERFLTLRSGRYGLFQRLPPLLVSHGDFEQRTGSLAVHVAADLMRYCEQAGLTGCLRLENEGRTAHAIYDRGDLVGIKVDGSEHADLRKVFGWEEGTFAIEARPLARSLDEELDLASEPASASDSADGDPTVPRVRPRADATGQNFLRVVEVALAKIMQDRESYRPPSRSSPPLPPLARPRAKPVKVPAPAPTPGVVAGAAVGVPLGRTRAAAEDREPTVKIVYHSLTVEPLGPSIPVPRVGPPRSKERPMANESERPERAGQVREEPIREPGETELEAAPPVHTPSHSPSGRPPAEKTSLLGTAVWIAVMLALALLTLRFLAWLPPMG